MIIKQLVYHTDDSFLLNIKEHGSEHRLITGQIKELNSENNKAYRKLLEHQIKDFYINHGSVIIWI